MQPLVFLTTRTLANGIRRALTSGRRLIGLIFFVGYYAMLMFRPLSRPERATEGREFPFSFTMPPLGVLDAIVFTLFAFLSFMLVMNVMGYRGGFRKADVDVLFPTPVSPKVVLVFRIARDYLFTLLIPLFLAIVGWYPARDGIGALIRNFPEHGSMVGRTALMGWFLMAMCWVSIGYAASMFVNRSDLESDRNKRLIGVAIGTALASVAIYVTLAFRADPSWQTYYDVNHAPGVRLVFFVASAATLLVMAPLRGDLGQGLLGFGLLAGIIVLSFRVAMTQVGWLYDQAAAKGFDSQDMRAMRQKGDYYGMMAEQARMGKVKVGRMSRFLGRFRPPGPIALVWKEWMLQSRASVWTFALFVPITLFLVGMPLYVMPVRQIAETRMLFFLFEGVVAFMLAMNAYNGVVEMLRRVDLQKPLPFTASVIVFWEVMAKSAPNILLCWMGCLLALVLQPLLWADVLVALVMAPSMTVLLVGAIHLVTILFPDVDDPTQRGFRGLMTLLSLSLLGLPSCMVFAGLMAVGIPSWLSAIPFIGLNAVFTFLGVWVSGWLYAGYNPSE